VPALAGQDLTARDLIRVKPRHYNLALLMLHCNIASGQATCARQAWNEPRSRRAGFQREFPDHVGMMRELRGAGLARTEGGDQPKLTIKVPSAIRRTGRVYWVVIDTETA